MRELLYRLTWVDYIALITLLIGLVVGYKSGFLQELLRLVGYVATLLIALLIYETVAQALTLHTFLNLASAKVIAFSVILVLVYLAIKLLRAMVTKILKVGEGGLFQRLLGALAGGARMLMLLSFFFMLVDRTPLRELKADVHQRSLTGPYLSVPAPLLYDFLTKVSPQWMSPQPGAGA